MKPINLNELFNMSQQPDSLKHYYCIYKITNLINQDAYIGQAVDFYYRFNRLNGFGHKGTYLWYVENDCTHSHLYNALRKYGLSNFEVSILEENLLYFTLNDREIYWIAVYNTYKGRGYNMNSGGNHCEQLRARNLELWPQYNGANPAWFHAGWEALRIKYPDTNGMPIECWEANKKKYPETNGMPTECLEAGHAANREKYPDTNGMPTEALEAAWASMKERYPDTNGAPPQWIKAMQEGGRKALLEMFPDSNGTPPAFWEAGREALKEMFPDSNGMSPKCWEAGHAAMKEKYPETNGISPECIKAGLIAGHKALLEKYPDSNGVPPEFWEAGQKACKDKYKDTNGMPTECLEASRSARIRRSYEAWIKMCEAFIADGHTKWTVDLYWRYKVPGSARPEKIYAFYENCLRLNLDITLFKETFPEDWIPEKYR